MITVAQQFNSLMYGTLSTDERYSLDKANKQGRIFLCPRFIYLCMGREGIVQLSEDWGIKLNMLLRRKDYKSAELLFMNYSTSTVDVDWGSSPPYPDLVYQKEAIILAILGDVGQGCRSVDEVKQSVRDWVFDTVVPLYLEHLFS